MGEPKHIAIVGGGLAGLAAAVELSGRGLNIELFESRKQLGGRAGSFRDSANDLLVDHCQHVSLGCCSAWLDFCRRTGLDAFTRRDSTLHFIGPDGRRCDISASRWLPAPLHLLPSLLRLRYLTWGERIGIIRAIRALKKASTTDNPNGPTIDEWLRENGQSSRAIELFWAPVIVSALSETLVRASVPPVRKVFVDAFLGNRRAYEMIVPTVSLGELYGTKLEGWLRSRGVVVHRECGVTQLCGDAKGVREVELAIGERHIFDAVIVAVPWRRIDVLLSEPLRAAIPELQCIQQIESAPITAVHLWFDRAITELPHAVLPGRTSQWMFNRGNELSAGHHYQIVISASRELEKLARSEVIDRVLAELTELWPLANKAKLLQSRMITDQHAVFSARPGADQLRPQQQTSVPNLFLAGDWTATGWPATMEGAVRSGYEAAKIALTFTSIR
ncbi:MAG: FAD-dependent oxidoreductase [Pirellulales bacterium]|nr:FAD-dependent oxidoreductase [Pirellulales bacterium]